MIIAVFALVGSAVPARAEAPAPLWTRLVEVVRPSMSVGEPSFGLLRHGVLLRDGEGLFVRTRDAWGVAEVIGAIRRAAAAVARQMPGGAPLVITDISRRNGGRFRPHSSHQTGRDVDVALYRKLEPNGEIPRRFAISTFDVARTWALIEAMLRDGMVEVMWLDYWMQARLFKYARDELKQPVSRLRKLFAWPRGRRTKSALVQHARGHRTHLHIRFRAPIAELVAALDDQLRGVRRLVHQVRRGETLVGIARRYGVAVADLARWNRLHPERPLSRWRKLWVLAPLAREDI